MSPSGPRYAVYFTPATSSPLWQFGCGIIGYDAATGAEVPLQPPAGLDWAKWRALTAEPRRYGFHATLKAPFHLAPAASEAGLLDAVASLSTRLTPAGPTVLGPNSLGSFLALTIEGDDTAVHALAAETVLALEPLRAPLEAADRARRLAAPLTQRQIASLDRFGYPYVLEDFRFHMTLTGPLDVPDLAPVLESIRTAYRARVSEKPVWIDGLSVLRQERRDARFRIIARFPIAPRPAQAMQP
ncbi:MAG: DUF1045 domain-containing protein [Hyphomicrobiaceae bacterium]|nr:DUF1045 domain-containing protein [Hyphomicrobiaceae bacterium]